LYIEILAINFIFLCINVSLKKMAIYRVNINESSCVWIICDFIKILYIGWCMWVIIVTMHGTVTLNIKL